MPHGHGLGGWTGLNALIGHLGNGDNSYGWRFLDVVFGALVVMLLYVFAKRVTGSTLFATIAALLLTFDGMHFVQSRIATPEGFVVFFATLATSTRFIASGSARRSGTRPHRRVPNWQFVAGIRRRLAAGSDRRRQVCRLAFHIRRLGHERRHRLLRRARLLDSALLRLAEALWRQAPRADVRRGLLRAARRGQPTTLFAADGGSIDSRARSQRGAVSQNKGGSLVYEDDPLTIEYRRDAGVNYETPEGEVLLRRTTRFATETVVEQRPFRKAAGWCSSLVALGFFVASKWYGVMGFGVSFVVLIAVWLQRYFFAGRPTLWGNPRGFRLDGALADDRLRERDGVLADLGAGSRPALARP